MDKKRYKWKWDEEDTIFKTPFDTDNEIWDNNIHTYLKKKKSSIAAIISSIFRFQGSFIEILLKIDNFMYKRITKWRIIYMCKDPMKDWT